MITRLPGWVWLGGWVLALIGGMINAVGFLGFTHEAVTHLTGTTTLLAIAVGTANGTAFLHFLAVLASYFCGAVASGFIIQQSTLQLGHRYGVVLFIESALLFLAVPLLIQGSRYGYYFASGACGLQNAMASSYSGAVIRTTHVSGIITDLGIFTGHYFRGLPLDLKRARLYAILLSGFFLGGVMGAILFVHFSYKTLYVPAVLTGACGLAYTSFKLYKNRRSKPAGSQS